MTTDLPRFPLVLGPTPLHELPRLREALGGPRMSPRLLMKRDDLAGPALGGNKARKLEFLVADALEAGATHLVTVGGVQSNHARMTAAAARLAGLECTLVLTSDAPDPEDAGNLLLDRLLGASVRFVPPGPVPLGPNPSEDAAIAEEVESIAANGGRAYVIPLGASNPLGTLGYVRAAREMDGQLREMGIQVDGVYFAAGSRGTHAGLELARRLDGSRWRARGVAVSPGDEQKALLTKDLVSGAADLLGERLPVEVSANELTTDQRHYGDGYGVPTIAGAAAIHLLARTEAVLLDPTYTAKAMAGLIADIRSGALEPGETIVFLHTGGVPGLFASPPSSPRRRGPSP